MGWREYVTIDGRPYYFNTVTKSSQWDRPAEFGQGDVPPLSARSWQSLPIHLPAGWEAAYSQSGDIYYFNRSTGVRSWALPIDRAVAWSEVQEDDAFKRINAEDYEELVNKAIRVEA